jgi:hypothetical protein
MFPKMPVLGSEGLWLYSHTRWRQIITCGIPLSSRLIRKVIAHFDMTISDTCVHLRHKAYKASNASSKYSFDDFHSSHLLACGARRGIHSSPYLYGKLAGNQVAHGDRLFNGRRPRTPFCDALSKDSLAHHQL